MSSKPRKPNPKPLVEDETQETAPRPPAKQSRKKRGRRIDRLFSNLDKEVVDPNLPVAPPAAEPPPAVERDSTPPSTGQTEREPVPRPQHPAKPVPETEPRPYTPRWSGSLGFRSITTGKNDGVADEEILPAESILTESGWHSLKTRRPIAESAKPDQPASLAYSLPLGEIAARSIENDPQQQTIEQSASLLLEIMDEESLRQWSEDELLLVQQVTDQLSLALENARLFEESRTRSEYLAILNEMSRALSAQLNTEDVVTTVYHYTSQLVDTTNFQLALFHPDNQMLSFPLLIEGNTRVQRPARKIGHSLTEQVIESRHSILIRERVNEWITKQPEFEALEREVKSWLGVPMISGDQVIGVIAVQSFDQPNRYNENDRDLLNAVANQAAVALLNARLFEQTQTALSALEVSERYQKSVAQAVAILTERGIAALSNVLEILGEATQASRAYYVETQVDGRGPYWRIIAEWRAPEAPSQLDNPAMRRLSADQMTPWLEQLRQQSFATAVADDRYPEQVELFHVLGARSVLHLAVSGRHELPGCIGFEQLDRPRRWGDDEVSALQTAAAALSNTIAREDLFTQVQINLAETEALYQASARLNSAANYQDILNVLRQHTILGHVNTANITLNVFERPWAYRNNDDRGEPPEWLISLARWSDRNPQEARTAQPASERYPLDSWPTIDVLLQPERPTVITDIINDPRIDQVGREIYTEQMGAKSLIYVPLNVAGQWIGHIIGVYRQTTGFPEGEVRRLTSLAGQAAVAVQNLQSIDLATDRAQEAQERSEELTTLNQITSAASRSLDLNEVLDEVLNRLLQSAGFDSGLVSVADATTGQLKLAVHKNLPERMVERLLENGLDGTPCELVFRKNRTIHVSDLANILQNNPDIAAEQHIFDGPRGLGFQSYLGVPLESKGSVLGTVCIFHKQVREVDSSGIAIFEAVGQQLGVVVENARLFQETQGALNETEALYQASAELSAAESYDEILQTLRKYTLLGSADKLVHISLFSHPWEDESPPEWVTPIAYWSVLPTSNLQPRYQLNQYPAISYLSPSEPTIFADIPNDSRIDENTRRLFVENFEAQSAIFIPVFVGGEWIGYINAAFSTPAVFPEAQVRQLLSMAGQAAIAIQNRRLLEESLRRANQLQTAAEIARDSSSTLALEALLRRSVNLLRDRFNYYHASIFLLDENGAEAIVRESTGKAGEEMKRRGHKLTVGGPSVIGQVTLTGAPLVLNDITQEHARAIHQPNPLLPNTRAELGIPLKIGERVFGALDVQATQPDAFSDDDISVLLILADQIAVGIDNARSYEITQQAVEDIREADRLKSQFLANMSHELRTPLNSIIGFSRVILKGIDGPINELQKQDLSAIYNAGQHLLGLINDVLDLSKIEAGKMELAFEDNINLGEIIRGVMSTTVGLVKDKPVELKQVVDANIPLLRIDPMKIRQVLLNLLSNAAKFTEEGSITAKAELKSSSDGVPEVLISIIDTGAGIAPEDQAKLFQPFSQVDGSLTRKTGGSGLGLSISHHLIRLHGGRIGLRSKIGKGSKFYFTLPLVGPTEPVELDDSIQPELPDLDFFQDNGGIPDQNAIDQEEVESALEETTPLDAASPVDAPDPEKQSSEGADSSTIDAEWSLMEPPVEPAAEPPPGMGLVLAIDRDPQVIDFYRRYLSNHGYTVIAVTELEQVVTVAQGIFPSVITLDITMVSDKESKTGSLDGWQILQELKSTPLTKNIPVIICSMIDEREKAMEMGAAAYLLKPVLEFDLANALKDINNLTQNKRSK